jgi:uncharacterized protein (DUF305 family)
VKNVALLSRAFVRKRVISMATTMSLAATSLALAQGQRSLDHLRAAAADNSEQQFLIDNDLAMSRMSRAMLASPTGDVDRDFVAMMIPHHQGEIDVAQAELKYGHNEELRRLAQNIVSEQAPEISLMRRAIGQASQPGLSNSQQVPASISSAKTN